MISAQDFIRLPLLGFVALPFLLTACQPTEADFTDPGDDESPVEFQIHSSLTDHENFTQVLRRVDRDSPIAQTPDGEKISVRPGDVFKPNGDPQVLLMSAAGGRYSDRLGSANLGSGQTLTTITVDGQADGFVGIGSSLMVAHAQCRIEGSSRADWRTQINDSKDVVADYLEFDPTSGDPEWALQAFDEFAEYLQQRTGSTVRAMDIVALMVSDIRHNCYLDSSINTDLSGYEITPLTYRNMVGQGVISASSGEDRGLAFDIASTEGGLFRSPARVDIVYEAPEFGFIEPRAESIYFGDLDLLFDMGSMPADYSLDVEIAGTSVAYERFDAGNSAPAVHVDAAFLPDGVYTLVARFENAFGLQSKAERTITLINSRPTTRIESPRITNTPSDYDFAVSLQGNLSGVESIHFDGLSFDVNSENLYSGEVSLSPGLNVIEVTLANTDGSTHQSTETVVVDQTPPEVIVEPINAAYPSTAGDAPWEEFINGSATLRVSPEMFFGRNINGVPVDKTYGVNLSINDPFSSEFEVVISDASGGIVDIFTAGPSTTLTLDESGLGGAIAEAVSTGVIDAEIAVTDEAGNTAIERLTLDADVRLDPLRILSFASGWADVDVWRDEIPGTESSCYVWEECQTGVFSEPSSSQLAGETVRVLLASDGITSMLDGSVYDDSSTYGAAVDYGVTDIQLSPLSSAHYGLFLNRLQMGADSVSARAFADNEIKNIYGFSPPVTPFEDPATATDLTAGVEHYLLVRGLEDRMDQIVGIEDGQTLGSLAEAMQQDGATGELDGREYDSEGDQRHITVPFSFEEVSNFYARIYEDAYVYARDNDLSIREAVRQRGLDALQPSSPNITLLSPQEIVVGGVTELPANFSVDTDQFDIRLTVGNSLIDAPMSIAGGTVETIIDTTEFSDGAYEVSKTVTDVFERSAADSINMMVDNTPPEAYISDVPEIFNNTSTTIDVEWSDPNFASAELTYQQIVDDEIVEVTAVLEQGENFLPVLIEGTNTYWATFKDLADNVTTIEFQIIRNMSPPEIEFIPEEIITNDPSNVSVEVNVIEENEYFYLGDLDEGMNVIDPDTLQEGNNPYFVEVEDIAGNVATATYVIVIDTIPPELNVIPETNFTNQPENLSVIVEATDESGVFVGAYDEDGNFGPGPLEIGTNFVSLTNEGENVFNPVAMDAAGNTAEETVVIVLDTIPPDVEWALNKDYVNLFEGVYYSRFSEAEITISATDENGTIFDQSEIPHGTSMLVLSEEGLNSFRYHVEDLATNVTKDDVEIIRDTIAPVLELIPERKYTNETEVDITLEVEEENPFDVLDGWVEGAGNIQTLENEGSNLVTARARDVAGNLGEGEVEVFLDTIPPEVELSPETQFTNQDQAEVNVTISDASPYEVFLDLEEGNNTIDLPEDGVFTKEVLVIDAATNETHKEAEIIKDTSEPEVTIIVPGLGGPVYQVPEDEAYYISSDQITLDVEAFDMWGYTLSGDVVTEAPTNYGLTENAENPFTTYIEDFAGNTNEDNILVISDTIDPDVSLEATATPYSDGNVYISGTQAEVSLQVIEDNPFTVTGDVTSLDGHGPTASTMELSVEGANTFEAIATDAARNVGTDSVTIFRDMINPEVTLSAQANQTDLDGEETWYYINDTVVDLDLVISDASPVEAVGAFTVSGDGGGSEHWSRTFEDLAENDSTSLEVMATDAASNTGSDAIVVISDTLMPTATIEPIGLVERDGQYFTRSSPSAESFSYLADDENPFHYQVGIRLEEGGGLPFGEDEDNFSLFAEGSREAGNTSSDSIEIDLIENALNRIAIDTQDAALNTSSSMLEVFHNRIAPDILLHGPGGPENTGTVYTNEESIDLTAVISDQIPFDYTLRFDGRYEFDETEPEHNQSLADTREYSLPDEDGEFTFDVSVSDFANNDASALLTVVRDTSAPTGILEWLSSDGTEATLDGERMIFVQGTSIEMRATGNNATPYLFEGGRVLADNSTTGDLSAGSRGAFSFTTDWVTGEQTDEAVIEGFLPDSEGQVRLDLEDRAGNESSVSATVVTDDTPPQVTLSADSAEIYQGDFFVSGDSVEIDMIVLERNPFTYEGDFEGEYLEGAEDTPYHSSDSFSLPFEGTHSFEATATDYALNQGTAEISIIRDTIAPDINSLEPQREYTNESEAAIDFEAYDINPFDVDMEIAESGASGSSSGSGTIAGTISLDVAKNMENTVTMTATDKALNESTDSVTFIHDDIPPTGSVELFDVFSNAPVSIEEGQSATVYWDASSVALPGHDPATALVSALDANPIDVFRNGSSEAFASSEDGSVSADINDSFSEGAHNESIRLEDAAGNVADIQYTVIVDTTDPEVELSEVAGNLVEGVYYTSNPHTDLTLSITDINLDRYSGGLDGDMSAIAGDDIDPESLTGGLYERAGIQLSLVEEEIVIAQVSATDRANNTGDSNSISIVHDATPAVFSNAAAPTANYFSDTDRYYTSASETDIQVDVSDNVAVHQVRVLEGDGTVAASFMDIGTTFFQVSNQSVGLAEGDNDIVLEAHDRALNESTESVVVVRDTTSPVIEDFSVVGATEVAGVFYTNSTMPEVSFTVVEDNLDWYSGGIEGLGEDDIEFGGGVPGGPYSVDAGSEGAFTIDLDVADRADNMASAELSMVVDTTPPSLELIPSTTLTSGDTVEIEVVASDDYGFELSGDLDSTGVHTVSLDEDGVHAFSVTATDWAGNSVTETVYIERDTTPPEVTVNFIAGIHQVVDGVAYSRKDEITVDVSADDPNGATFAPGGLQQGEQVLQFTDDGEALFEYTVQDDLGNEVSGEVRVFVDRAVPVASMEFDFPLIFGPIETTMTVETKSDLEALTVEVVLDGQDNQILLSDGDIPIRDESEHYVFEIDGLDEDDEIQVTFQDMAGNVGFESFIVTD